MTVLIQHSPGYSGFSHTNVNILGTFNVKFFVDLILKKSILKIPYDLPAHEPGILLIFFDEDTA
jgi:hypothetical protein